MSDVDPRLVAALERQLRQRTGKRVGWKLGIGDRERLGDEIAVGHLSSATLLQSGDSYTPEDGEALYADAEVAVEIGADGQIAGYGAALELVDLRAPPNTPEDVVAQNVFHRVVAFGPFTSRLPTGEARLVVDGELRDEGRSSADLVARLREAARILEAVGEALKAGDRVITGSVVQVPVAPGEAVEADLGELGSVRLQVLDRS
jgi:2-keto-4-pentenoate hydratase